MKVCKTCGLEKLLIHFSINYAGTSREKIRDKCHTCVNKATRGTYSGRIRVSCLRHGIIDLQYIQMEFDQDRRCAICKQSKPLEIDHCHTTGKVRGLLCSNCNKVLGMVGDKIETLKEAIRYLEKNE